MNLGNYARKKPSFIQNIARQFYNINLLMSTIKAKYFAKTQLI